MEILESFKENPVLKKVLYLANSPRIKFYLRTIPSYTPKSTQRDEREMRAALEALDKLHKRELSGQAGLDHLKMILESCTPDDAYVIERIIDRDCKIGMGTTNINKIFPALIENTPYMGAIPFSVKSVKALFGNGKKAFSQVKMDGRYANITVEDGTVSVESRQGEANPLDSAAFIQELKRFPNCVLNGELTMKGFSRYVSNGIIASLVDINKKIKESPASAAKEIAEFEANAKKKGINSFQHAMDLIRFTVWDTITLSEYVDNKSDVPYDVRLKAAGRLVKDCTMVQLVYSRLVTSYEEAIEHFQEALNAGEEGTIVKAFDGRWVDNKPTWQVKLKLEFHVDLIITGFNYGTGKNSAVISSLDATSSDGLVVCSPTGMKEAMMKEITKQMSTLKGTIVEVKCNGLSQDSAGNYSLLHPVFKKLRDDKTTADDLQQIKNIQDMAKGLKQAMTIKNS
jgi:ATP-dependent DNA ligase